MGVRFFRVFAGPATRLLAVAYSTLTISGMDLLSMVFRVGGGRVVCVPVTAICMGMESVPRGFFSLAASWIQGMDFVKGIVSEGQVPGVPPACKAEERNSAVTGSGQSGMVLFHH